MPAARLSPRGGTPTPGRAATMNVMGASGEWDSRWAGAVLTTAAVTEAIVRGASVSSGMAGWAAAILAAATTVPLAFLGPAAAAAAVTSASLLSLTVFQTLTVAGLLAQLIALYRLGPSGGPRLLAPALALPFPAVALADPGPAGAEAGVLVVLLASLAPAAALAGI